MIGKTLLHYEIIRKIGSGGMGDVYLARDTKLGRDVAIKVLPERVAQDPERHKRFEREARSVAALNHPNVVTIHSVEEADGHVFLTMELVEGNELGDGIPRGGFPLIRFLELATAIAEGVGAAHKAGITHRDLKPANIKLTPDGRVKILDFGLAKLTDVSRVDDRTMSMLQSETAEGKILGTVTYMSPEQAQGLPVDQRSDIFSLGIVLYQMATGDLPFQGTTSISTISAILKDTPSPVTDLRRDVPRHLGRIISRCLEKSADQRYQSAGDLAIELNRLHSEVESGEHGTASSGVSATPEAAPSPSAPDRSTSETSAEFATPRRSSQWPLVMIGFIVIAAILVWKFVPGRSGETTAAADRPGTAETASSPIEDSGGSVVVVLPFEHLGPEDQRYFTRGMSTEITSRLTRVADLAVISRTSANHYDRTGKTIKQIGADLGVDFVLEGVVQWAADERVRITPTLIRVSDDTQTWTETFDRQVTDIFQLQSEIATLVVGELGVTLGAIEAKALQELPTENAEAYRLFVRARETPAGLDIVASQQETLRLLERALELDPEFLIAWCELAEFHLQAYFQNLDHSEAVLTRAREALDRAEALAPDNPATLVTRGYYYYYGFSDYDLALEQFERALEAVPNHDRAIEAIGYIHRRKGNWDRAYDYLLRATKLDPQDANIWNNLASLQRGRREFAEAMEFWDRAMLLAPEDGRYVFERTLAFVEWTGDTDQARRDLLAGPPGFWRRLGLLDLHAKEGDLEQAIEIMETIPMPGSNLYLNHMRAFHVWFRDGLEAARPHLEEAVESYERALEEQPNSASIHGGLAEIHAMLGNREKALGEARLAINLTSQDRFTGPVEYETLARVHAYLNEPDQAVDILERLLGQTYENSLTLVLLQMDPRLRPLHGHPKYEELIARDQS